MREEMSDRECPPGVRGMTAVFFVHGIGVESFSLIVKRLADSGNLGQAAMDGATLWWAQALHAMTGEEVCRLLLGLRNYWLLPSPPGRHWKLDVMEFIASLPKIRVPGPVFKP